MILWPRRSWLWQKTGGWLEGDMLFTKGDRLYMPTWGDLRRAILKECHDSKWTGNSGITRMLTLVEGTYYWTRMGDDVETFVRTCLICQQDKIEQRKSGRLLVPLLKPKGPWESVSIDFITCLPKSEKGGSIICNTLKYERAAECLNIRGRYIYGSIAQDSENDY
ncbi:putative nucleotidyltransferase, ribonuclease H [Tanacetum coccineum]